MYSGMSPVLGQGTASASSIDAWFRLMGQRLAPQYAPDQQYQEPPQIGEAIIRISSEIGCNSDLVASQICKESAGWQSRIVRDKHNPAGLGAENDDPYGKALTFATPEDGIRATVAHLGSYVLGDANPLRELSKRHEILRSRGYLGSVRILSQLDGKWAYPGVGYGAGIADLANNLVVYHMSQPTEGQPMSAEIPGFQWQPADSEHYRAGRSQRIRGGAQHYTGGSNSLPWLTTTSGRDGKSEPVSATFLVKHDPTMEDRGWQLVKLRDTAWTTAFANPYTVSIEYEHHPNIHSGIPDIAYEVLAQTWIDIAREVERQNLGSIPLDRTGIRGHGEWVNSPNYICPDGINVNRIVERIQARLAGEAPPAAVDSDELEFKETGQKLIGGFKAFWLEIGGRIGLPETPEIDYDDPTSPDVPENPLPGKRRIQRCQKAVLIWLPELPHGAQVQLLDMRSELFRRVLQES